MKSLYLLKKNVISWAFSLDFSSINAWIVYWIIPGSLQYVDADWDVLKSFILEMKWVPAP